ncbi:MAG: MinD/ParA family protein [Microbacterium sp.]
MASERYDNEADDNGILANTGGIDTTGIGIGEVTAHLDVSLPSPVDDDLVDDDVVVDEAPVTNAVPSVDASPALARTPGSTVAPRSGAAVAPHDRLRPRTSEITLQSRRLGDLGADRESSDLLTAERLVDPARVVRPEPEGAWRQFVYTVSGRRINLGDGKRVQARKALDLRIGAPLAGGAKFVPVLSRKGGVGKTTVTTLVGMALADTREDRIIAIDANPDRGTLAERIGRASGRTVRDLVRVHGEVRGFNDISQIVARDSTRLDVIASDTDPHVSEAFSDRDYQEVADVAAHYYSIVLTDTGTGIVHSVMDATLQRADELIVVAGMSVDEARLASETLTWLESNGYADRVRSAIVVLNCARPGEPLVRPDELVAHFRTRVRSVVRVPYDPHIALGSAISFRDLLPETREAARQLAAVVVEGLRAPAAV